MRNCGLSLEAPLESDLRQKNHSGKIFLHFSGGKRSTLRENWVRCQVCYFTLFHWLCLPCRVIVRARRVTGSEQTSPRNSSLGTYNLTAELSLPREKIIIKRQDEKQQLQVRTLDVLLRF